MQSNHAHARTLRSYRRKDSGLGDAAIESEKLGVRQNEGERCESRRREHGRDWRCPWETDLSARDDSLKEESAGSKTKRRKDPKL
jgi:hypothetical protein